METTVGMQASALSSFEPSSAEVRVTLLLGQTLARGVYTGYVKRLGLRGDERVLDYGSGSGVCSQHIARRLTSGHLTCVDVSRVWLDVARRTMRRYANVDYRLGDIRTLQIAPGSYDVVLMHFVLHEIGAADRPAVCAALARALAPGGRLCLREPRRSIKATEVCQALEPAGLRAVSSDVRPIFSQGQVYEGVWRSS